MLKLESLHDHFNLKVDLILQHVQDRLDYEISRQENINFHFNVRSGLPTDFSENWKNRGKQLD